MFNILAQIRIALRPGAELGEMIVIIIQDEFIPKISKMIEQEQGDTSKLQEVRNLWIEYSDKGNPNSQLWTNIANKQLQTATMKFPAFKGDIQDVESRLVEGFLSEGRYRRTIDRIDVKAGPLAFARYLSGVIHDEALNAYRNIFNASPEHGLGKRSEVETEDGDESPRSVLDQLESPAVTTNLDLDSMKKQLGRLDRAFKSKYGHNAVMMAVYEAWMQLARDKGADKINFKKDVEIPLLERFKTEGIKGNRAYISQMKQEMLKFFLGFFKEEEGEEEDYTARARGGSLKIAEALAVDDFRRKMASWVLELYRFAPR